jgi:hypothetical protein
MRWNVKRRSTRAREERIRNAVWQAQLVLATRSPARSTAAEPDSVVGATVEHSVHVEAALTTLLNVLGPNHPLTLPTFEANLACAEVALLHESWAAHCAETARPGADDTVLALDREFPDPDRVRAWTRYETARQRTAALAERLAALEPQLTTVTGHDLCARRLPATA